MDNGKPVCYYMEKVENFLLKGTADEKRE